mmetsp:Transcript_97120/g.313011  ORF Transcript_97120/g.313011 Transcript_97120/m.313011 type:complete len:204 (+) Transcript_97120:205-816(+)
MNNNFVGCRPQREGLLFGVGWYGPKQCSEGLAEKSKELLLQLLDTPHRARIQEGHDRYWTGCNVECCNMCVELVNGREASQRLVFNGPWARRRMSSRQASSWEPRMSTGARLCENLPQPALELEDALRGRCHQGEGHCALPVRGERSEMGTADAEHPQVHLHRLGCGGWQFLQCVPFQQLRPCAAISAASGLYWQHFVRSDLQ